MSIATDQEVKNLRKEEESLKARVLILENPPEEDAQQPAWWNYVAFWQNNGFIVGYEWNKDALIQKNGIVKYWWEEKKEVTKESYFGLTEGQYLILKQDQSIEFVDKKFYDDPE